MTKLLLAASALAALVLVPRSYAEEGESPGKKLYLQYCGACHGPAAKGDGIAGTYMRPKPADLTQIAKKNGGEFPAQRTMEVIDGRRTVRAHGDPDMPVWGQILDDQASGAPHQRAMVKGTIALITGYLASLQEK